MDKIAFLCFRTDNKDAGGVPERYGSDRGKNIFIRGEQTWKKTEFDQSSPAEPSV